MFDLVQYRIEKVSTILIGFCFIIHEKQWPDISDFFQSNLRFDLALNARRIALLIRKWIKRSH